MIKYAKIINQETGLCEVGLGTNIEFYKSIGMNEMDVAQSDVDNNWYLASMCPMKTDEQKEQEERERIAKLCLTGADVERGIFKARGADFEDIINMIGQMQIDSDPRTEGIELKALKIELKANHFYRGNPYIDAVGTLLGFTTEQLDQFFETGDYTALIDEPKEVFNLEEV